jgi:hypothetical protein
MQDRLAFLHMLEQLKVNDIPKTFLRSTTMRTYTRLAIGY